MGLDDISIKFFKVIFLFISDVILSFVNSILIVYNFPSKWKIAGVVPIPKKKAVDGPDDLRPIPILLALSKVVLKHQISTFIDNTISMSQYAFRNVLSPTSLLLCVTDQIRSDMNRMSILVSMDLSKAFNSIKFDRMILKLSPELNRSACRFVMSYLRGRSQYVVVNGTASTILSLHSGVPQGSVLGPLLFILYFNDFANVVSSPSCRSFICADDVYLLFSASQGLM